MSFPKSPHLSVGDGEQVGLITLWTKKEHVLSKVPSHLYAVASQLYSRDEGLSLLVRSLLLNPRIRDLVVVGADLNRCADTLFALWREGVENGAVIGAPGYLDPEIPKEAVDRLRENVELHDLRSEKDYAKLASFIESLTPKPAWGEPERYQEPRITPPALFPTAHQHVLRHKSISSAAVELAHLCSRFGTLANVQLHLTEKGVLPDELVGQEPSYTDHLLGREPGTYGELLHRNSRLDRFVGQLTAEDVSVITLAEDVEGPLLDLLEAIRLGDGIHLSAHIRRTNLSELPLLSSALFSLLGLVSSELDEPAGTVTVQVGLLEPSPRHLRESWSAQAHVLRRTGDPRSNILIRLRDGRIAVTHLSPEGKRLEEFVGDSAMELYKRLIVEHRITDLSHAAYLGYELAKAENALRTGGMYEQDSTL